MSSGNASSYVKNRAPAEVQLTVDHLLREAQQFVQEPFAPTRTKINSEEELLAYRASKRKEFETSLHHNRHNFGAWIKYAKWEAEQKEFDRARSIYERALDIDPANTGIWQKYALMEMQHGFVDSARNVWTRATQTVPRFDPFWFKWCYMEEKLGNLAGARSVLESWMRWAPGPDSWNLYINFELRHGNIAGARRVYEGYLACHDTVDTFLKYARFEAEHGGSDPSRARAVYERARLELGQEEVCADSRWYLSYAAFEEGQHNWERCRALYREALDVLPRAETEKVLAKYTAFEKQRGGVAGVEDVVLSKRRLAYEAEVSANPMAYDAWIEYIRLEEHCAGLQLDAAAEVFRLKDPAAAEAAAAAAAAATGADADADASAAASAGGAGGASAAGVQLTVSAMARGVPLSALPAAQRDAAHARVRELYERAVAQVPPVRGDKEAWRRYIWLWIGYAVYEELFAECSDRARAVYKQCLELIPHRAFTFSRVWILAAELEVRAGRVDAMRKLLGFALGRCPRPRIFEAYIALESELGEVQRCRELYKKLLETFPRRAAGWVQFAALEADLAEADRARWIFSAALAAADEEGGLDEPAALWAAYVSFEQEQGDATKVRDVLSRQLTAARAADPAAVPAAQAQAGQLTLLRAHLDAAAFEAARVAAAVDAAARADAVTRTRTAFAAADDDFKARVAAAVAAAGGGGSSNLSLGAGAAGANATEDQIAAMVAAKEDRLRVLDAWRRFELEGAGDDAAAAEITEKKWPQKVKKTRKVVTEGGADAGFQEYYDYVYPDAGGAGGQGGPSKLLDMARKWKMMKKAAAGNDN